MRFISSERDTGKRTPLPDTRRDDCVPLDAALEHALCAFTRHGRNNSREYLFSIRCLECQHAQRLPALLVSPLILSSSSAKP